MCEIDFASEIDVWILSMFWVVNSRSREGDRKISPNSSETEERDHLNMHVGQDLEGRQANQLLPVDLQFPQREPLLQIQISGPWAREWKWDSLWFLHPGLDDAHQPGVFTHCVQTFEAESHTRVSRSSYAQCIGGSGVSGKEEGPRKQDSAERGPRENMILDESPHRPVCPE